MLLAAGLGKRLRPLTNLLPKPLAPVLNRPVMEHGLRRLHQHGFTEVVSNVSYMPERIEETFGDGSELGLQITWSEEDEPLGTAGGVRKVADFLGETDSFLIISGDGLTDIDLSAMREAHEAHDGIGTLATKRVVDTTEYGVVITGDDGRIQGFQEKPDPAEALSTLANCGIYMFRREIFDHFPGEGHTSPAGDPDQPPGFTDWAMDVFPALLENDVPFYSHEIDAYWNDIGNIEELVQGNFDALAGAVSIEPGAPRINEGVYAAESADLDRVMITPPVLVGDDVELGEGVELHGPVVIGDGARIGAGTSLRDALVLPGAELSPGAVAVGGAYGLDRAG
jgi:mannose-1-phosphate guanylyltransferase